MEILRNTKIDFMKYRRFWITVSFVVMAIGAVAVFFLGHLNMGIDFAGGTQLTLKFHQRPDVEQLRQVVSGAGIREPQIQRFGTEDKNEVIISTPLDETNAEGSAPAVLAALDGSFNSAVAGKSDLNRIGTLAVADLLAAGDPDGVGPEAAPGHYAGIAESVLAERKRLGLFVSWDEVARAAGVSPRALATLQQSASIGSFAVLASGNVSPQVGSELRQRGFLAVIGAMLGMLAYIWLRFELRFGVGATMAVLHDVLITLGIYAFMGYEFNLTTVAAFLTLIGYSVNDTVVTFDRVRENMRKSRGGDLLTLINRSLNEMLSRTLLTGGTTILASMMLWLFGGEAIRGFAFIILIGIVVGTYSSIYIASPFAILWEEWFGPGGRFNRGKDAPARRRPASAPAR
ncbi:MAG: protein translocase subunit SecF [Thermoanaerobaculia bacterium]|nr:MAG: protein translocase subunit SecF [Thermoanaerobaculia bacterium]MBZ0101286.1 protein translocase subunit SecF [Thermoanaerobaculia bacterium]